MEDQPSTAKLTRPYRNRTVRERAGGISNATLYRWMESPAHQFPKPKKVAGTRTNLWDGDEVEAWLSRQLGKAEAA